MFCQSEEHKNSRLRCESSLAAKIQQEYRLASFSAAKNGFATQHFDRLVIDTPAFTHAVMVDPVSPLITQLT
jgi:hypothetical protein